MVFTLKPFRKNEEIYVLDPEPSWKMKYNHINLLNLLNVAYSTLPFVLEKTSNFWDLHTPLDFEVGVVHFESLGLAMEANEHQRPEPPITPEGEGE